MSDGWRYDDTLLKNAFSVRSGDMTMRCFATTTVV